jgi:hypothetical protein
MKTKELIKRLQEADPSGELECCVGNIDIYFVTQEPAYYDGALQVLLHDETKRDLMWSIVGAKLTRHGSKVQIHALSIEDAMFDTVVNGKDFPVTVEGDSVDGHYQKMVKSWKAEAIRIHKSVMEKQDK